MNKNEYVYLNFPDGKRMSVTVGWWKQFLKDLQYRLTTGTSTGVKFHPRGTGTDGLAVVQETRREEGRRTV
jgi:hypothetical protein